MGWGGRRRMGGKPTKKRAKVVSHIIENNHTTALSEY